MNISVALCTYNGARYLREQLDSITDQSLLPDELIVCDDRSTDETISILEEFRNKASFPVHIHRNEKNLGSTKNFEKAISLCQGEIIALCDQDDIWKPNKLERLAEELTNNPDAGYAFSNAELVDEQCQPLGGLLWDSIKFTGESLERFYQGEQFKCFTKQHIVTGATMAFHKYIGLIAMPFPASGNWIHDGWISLVASTIGVKGIPIDEPLISYRQHSNQQIGAPPPSETKDKEVPKQRSLLEMYRDLKKNEQIYFEAWEYRGLKTLSVLSAMKSNFEKRKDLQEYPEFNRNLKYLKRFETHFYNRRKILKSRHPKPFLLILREALSGRYTEFSDSWRSILRDIFL